MGRRILITGSTDGIGRQAALDMARQGHGHRVVLHGRSPQRCEEAVAWLRDQLKDPEAAFEFVVGDFCRLSSVVEMAEDVTKRFPDLSVLLCNAGVLNPQRETTHDGLEMTFQVNHLAHFLLVEKLRPVLAKNAPSRVILVSSICHSWEEMDWDDVQAEKGYEKYVQYSRTKLGNHLHAFGLHRRLKDASPGLSALVLEPGVIATKLLRNGMGSGGSPIEQGPRAEVFCATDASLDGKSGLFFNAAAKEAKADAKANRQADQDRLWDLSVELLKQKGIQL